MNDAKNTNNAPNINERKRYTPMYPKILQKKSSQRSAAVEQHVRCVCAHAILLHGLTRFIVADVPLLRHTDTIPIAHVCRVVSVAHGPHVIDNSEQVVEGGHRPTTF